MHVDKDRISNSIRFSGSMNPSVTVPVIQSQALSSFAIREIEPVAWKRIGWEIWGELNLNFFVKCQINSSQAEHIEQQCNSTVDNLPSDGIQV